ncbi:hypothetical protein [Paenibacillus macquariensis]|uniref:Uncharacterized protein n=1 Tax=Paenibacillus macquariensis TaxID=948756 RepID=A0ABY1JVT3_9BACL|nr:hypothetical protein [Paenibacillus macquariensis]MEC0090673.1 hypothetical protein [Paenibacillus macquariensis]OAB34426.1 hypothetical protein PMSM_11170 [Paenibacillus macquariensis subsp. macquariensis]SIQ86545.1 hypothetical protein SAMN05421578_104399 [Paenibacillus macquariensis]
MKGSKFDKKVVFNITMGTQRIRKKRRRRIRKQNPLIVILASITIILLFVWGGLYWKESSEKAQSDDQTNGKERSQTSKLEADKRSTNEPLGMNLGMEEEPLMIGEMGDSIGISDDRISDDHTEVGGESISQSSNEAEKNEEIGAQSNSQPPVTSGTSVLSQPKPQSGTQATVQAPIQSEAQPQQQSNAQSNSQTNVYTSPPTTKPDSSSTVELDSPSTGEKDLASSKQTDAVVTPLQKYEQEMIKIEANCRKDMNMVLNGAENSIQKLDVRNFDSVQSWKENTTKEITTAESTCEVTYQDLIRNAEKDAVSTSVINEWKQTYNTLKVGLQDESRAKMQRLMGG